MANGSLSEVALLLGQANLTFPSMNDLYDFIGFTLPMDILYASLFLTTNIVGFILNCISLHVLNQKEFKTLKLYYFLRVYTTSGLITNVLQFTFVPAYCRRLLPSISSSYLSQAYIAYFFAPVHNMFTFLKFALDLAIGFDRIATFSQRVNHFYHMSARNICMLVFTVVLVLDSPYYFQFTIGQYEIQTLRTGQTAPLYFPSNSKFARNLAGVVILNIVYSIRHGLTLIVQIAMNVAAYILFHRYMKQKNMLIHNNADFPHHHFHTHYHSSVNAENAVAHTKEHMFNAERNVSHMIATLSLVSILHQLVLLGIYVYTLACPTNGFVTIALMFVANYCNNFRHLIAFWAFCKFNRNFKAACKNLRFLPRF
jgi:hypothetical protein